jgi:4-amino-4-deoxy-L-arabinose transferase-like glycosyltransferase
VIHPLARPDEQFVWNLAAGILAGDLNPHFFVWPSLFLYALAAADFLYLTGASLAHGSHKVALAALASDPRPFILIDRGLVAAIGSLTALLVYRVAAEAIGRRAGLVAAGLLGVAYLHVRDSHFGVTDVPLTALVCAALLQALRIQSRGVLRDYVRAGLLTGLAISTKYSGVTLLVPLVVAHGLGRRRDGPRSTLRLVQALALVPIGFLLGTPFASLAWSEFREGVTQLAEQHAGESWRGVALGPGWWRHLSFNLWFGLGPPLLAAGLVGWIPALRRSLRPSLVLLAFVAAYALLFGGGSSVFARYALPLVPILCIGAAALVGAAAERLPRLRVAAALGLAFAIALPSLRAAIAFDRLMAREDSRVLAARWLEAHVSPGDAVLLVGDVFSDPATFFEGRLAYDPFAWPPAAWSERGALPRGRPYRRAHNEHDPQLDAALADPRVRWAVVAQSPLVAYGPGHPLRARLRGFRRVEVIEGIGGNLDLRFDLQDAFYAPFSGADEAVRPGPNFHIYAR